MSKYKSVRISQTGFGVNDTETWELHSEQALTDEQVQAAIEKEKPSAGYGESLWTRVTRPGEASHVVRVTSWASCG